jgi:hypothetical protein
MGMGMGMGIGIGIGIGMEAAGRHDMTAGRWSNKFNA